jgi:hypothetical protein
MFRSGAARFGRRKLRPYGVRRVVSFIVAGAPIRKVRMGTNDKKDVPESVTSNIPAGAEWASKVNSGSRINTEWSRKAFGIGAVAVFVLMAVGILGMVIAPGLITGLGVPLGFTLWAVLYWLLKRRSRRINAR